MSNVIVNIYFIISGVLFVALQYKRCTTPKRIKEKFGDKYELIREKKSFFIHVAAFVRSLVISFIPIVNLFLLYILIFHENEVDDITDANVETAIREAEKNNV